MFPSADFRGARPLVPSRPNALPDLAGATFTTLALALALGCALTTAIAQENHPLPDLTVEVFADESQVQNVTAICFDDQGRLYVAESHRWRNGVEDNRDHLYWVMDDLASTSVEDRRDLIAKWEPQLGAGYFTQYSERILRLEDTDGDGKADRRTVFAEGFNDAVDGPAIGLLHGQGKIYLTSIPHLWTLEDRDGDGLAETKNSLHQGFGPRFSLSGHDLHGLVWGPDGKLYFSMGDRGFHVTTAEGQLLSDPGAGAVFRCDPDGANLEIFYYGLRNPQELAFNEFGDLFTVDNNCDQGDAARVSYLMEGGDTGWHMGHQALTTFTDQVEDGGMEQAPHWLSEGLWKKRFEGQPEWIVPAVDHLTMGPSGLVFHSGVSLPAPYENHFLVCDYKGSSSECSIHSFKVERTGAGYGMVEAHLFSEGITAADVDVGYDGKVYLGDFGGGWRRPDRGNIFALYDPEAIQNPVVAETEALFAEGFGTLPTDRLEELLAHPDWRVRQRSQFTLADRGSEVAVPIFRRVAGKEASGDGFLGRLHAIWGLGQLRAAAELRDLLGDAEAEIRSQAARALGELKDREAGEKLTALLADESPRVRAFGALALGKIGHAGALEGLASMLAENADRDPYLRHAGIMGLKGVAAPQTLAEFRTHSSRSVRLAAVVALRKQAAREIAAFLDDPDPSIGEEAIRAINDLPIVEALPDLVTHSAKHAKDIGEDSLPSEATFRRLINANFRAGSRDGVRHLMGFAANENLPESYRRLSLQALSLWLAPPPIDPTLGIYRPLEPRDPASVRDVVADPLSALLEVSEEPALIAVGVQVATAFDVALDTALLRQWLLDDNVFLATRLAVLNRFETDPPPTFQEDLSALMEDREPAIRVGAATARAAADPKQPAAMAAFLLEDASDEAKRGGLEILAKAGAAPAESRDEAVRERLLAELQRLAAGETPPALRLDVYEAGLPWLSDFEVGMLMDRIDESLGSHEAGVWAYTLSGGNRERGRRIFNNQGTCLKCHQTTSPGHGDGDEGDEEDDGGGDAGPSLAGLTGRLSPLKILESVTNPNAEIAPGYGIASVTLKDGTLISGSPLEEDDETLTMKTVDAGLRKIAKSDIAARSPEVSAMPPMGLVLSKKDLRDLMAYLQSLRAPRGAEPVRNEAESASDSGGQ